MAVTLAAAAGALWIGFTAKIRDAKIRLDQGAELSKPAGEQGRSADPVGVVETENEAIARGVHQSDDFRELARLVFGRDVGNWNELLHPQIIPKRMALSFEFPPALPQIR